MITGTLMAVFGEEGHQIRNDSLVNTKSLRHAIQIVKHLKEQRTRLVDRANHRPTLLRQALHQGHALGARSTVQTAVLEKSKSQRDGEGDSD